MGNSAQHIGFLQYGVPLFLARVGSKESTERAEEEEGEEAHDTLENKDATLPRQTTRLHTLHWRFPTITIILRIEFKSPYL